MVKDFPCSACGVPHPIGEHLARPVRSAVERKAIGRVNLASVESVGSGMPDDLAGAVQRLKEIREQNRQRQAAFRAKRRDGK